MEAAQARRLVEARLGRPPQDMLEAAVVLEAWAGVPAQRALETARALMPRMLADAAPSATRPASIQRPPGLVLEGAAFLVTVVAIALWAGPLAAGAGVDAVERALRLALPLTLALQWGLRSRYLARPSGLTALGRHRAGLALAAAALVAVPAALLGTSGALAGLLTLTWTGGSILIRRGWAAAYAAIVAGATPPLLAGARPLVVTGAVAATTALAVAAALRGAGTATRGRRRRRGATADRRRWTRGVASPPPPVSVGRWSRTLGAALTGACVGVMLVADPTVGWTAGAVGALALLPSAAGGLWGGHRLWELADALPRSVSGVSAGALVHDAAWGPLRVLLGAAARLIGLTAAASAALVVLTPTPDAVGVLAGFGVVALATLLVGLLEALGRAAWGALAVAGGVVAELLLPLAGDAPFPGAALLAGGAIAASALLPAAIVLLRSPARTLATALWIT